jgi:hypothetical protein
MIRPHRPTHPDDLMKPDPLSAILLVGTGIFLFVPLLLVLLGAISQSASLR